MISVARSLNHPLYHSLSHSQRTPISPPPRKLRLVAARHVVDAVVAQRAHQAAVGADLLDAAAGGAALRARWGSRRRRRRFDGGLRLERWSRTAVTTRTATTAGPKKVQGKLARFVERRLLLAVQGKVRGVRDVVAEGARHGELPLALGVAVAVRPGVLVGCAAAPRDGVATGG